MTYIRGWVICAWFAGCTLMWVNLARAQAPQKQWDKRFGGNASDDGAVADQTRDGGCILAGDSASGVSGDRTENSRGDYDLWILKVDGNGTKQWDKRFGGSSYDYCGDVRQTSDGGYILGGDSASGTGGDKTQSSRGCTDIWVLRIDGNGNKQWDKRFGGSSYDYCGKVRQTSDGGYILAGSSLSGAGGDKTQASRGGADYWIVKVDSNGSKQWDKRFGGDADDYLQDIYITSDYGYLLVGNSKSGATGDKTENSRGNIDFWIVKVDSYGSKQWDRRFGGIGVDVCSAVEQATDGGFVLVGGTSSPVDGDVTQPGRGSSDYWMLKVDSNGNKQWDRRFGGSGVDDGRDVQRTSDGGYILVGESGSGVSGDKTEDCRGYYDYWMVKTDGNGNKQWDKRFGGTSGYDRVSTVLQTSESGFLLAGYSESSADGDKTEDSRGSYDYWIVKTGPAQVAVANVHASQRSGTKLVDVSYDLNTTGPCSVTLAGSTNGGTTWSVPISTLVGDVGTNVSPGKLRRVIWNAGTDFDNRLVSNMVVQVTASNGTTFASGQSASFVLDTRAGYGMTCEWIMPTNGQAFRLGCPIPIAVRLLYSPEGTPATNAGVQVKLYLTNGVSYYSAYLSDDGVTGTDTNRGDGIYSGTMAAPTLLAEGDYALSLYAGYPAWRKNPRFVRSEQVIHLGDVAPGMSLITLELACDQKEPYLVGHAITATATLHCAVSEIVPGTTTVELKITPLSASPTGASRLQLEPVGGPASLTWRTSAPFTPTTPGVYEFLVEVKGLATLAPSCSEPLCQRVYQAIGHLEYWFAQPTGLQWEPFIMGAIATRVSGGNPIPDISVLATVTGAYTSVVSFPPTVADGSSETDFVPSNTGTYHVAFMVNGGHYFFPTNPAVGGSFSVSPNQIELRNATGRFFSNTVHSIDRIAHQAYHNAEDADYLMPFVVESSQKSDVIQNMIVNLAGAAFGEVFLKAVPHIPHVRSCFPASPELLTVADEATGLRKYAFLGPAKELGGYIKAGNVKDLARAANGIYLEAVIGEAVQGKSLVPTPADNDYAIGRMADLDGFTRNTEDDLEEFYVNMLYSYDSWLLTHYVQTESTPYHSFKNEWKKSAREVYTELCDNWPMIPSQDEDLVLDHLDAADRFGQFLAEQYELESFSYVNAIATKRWDYEHSATKVLDSIKWPAASLIASCILPGVGSYLSGIVEGGVQGQYAGDALRIEGSAVLTACHLVNCAQRDFGTVGANLNCGLVWMYKSEAGGVFEPLPKGEVAFYRVPELVREALLPYSSTTVRFTRSSVGATIRNTGSEGAVFYLVIQYSTDRIPQFYYTDECFLAPGQTSLLLGTKATFDTMDKEEIKYTLCGKSAKGVWYYLGAGWCDSFGIAPGHGPWEEEDSVGMPYPVTTSVAQPDPASATVLYSLQNPLPYPVTMELTEPLPESLAVESMGDAEVVSNCVVWRCTLEHNQSISMAVTIGPSTSSGNPYTLSNGTLRISDPTGSNTILNLPSTELPELRTISVSIPNLRYELVRGQAYALGVNVSNALPAMQTVTACVTIVDADAGTVIQSNTYVSVLGSDGNHTHVLNYTSGNVTTIVFTAWSVADPSNILYQTTRSVVADTDGDGMPDAWELAYGLNPTNSADAILQSDGDTLNNLQEYLANADPHKNDTDFDGISDVQELNAGTDPAFAPRADTDIDGLQDSWERRYFTNLTAYAASDDPDYDGLDNAFEYTIGTDPTKADTDGDGQSDYDEYWGGSDPWSADSVFGIRSLNLQAGGARVNFRCGDRSNYRLAVSTNNLQSFTPLGSPIAGSILGTMEITDSSATNQNPVFYRVNAIPK